MALTLVVVSALAAVWAMRAGRGDAPATHDHTSTTADGHTMPGMDGDQSGSPSHDMAMSMVAVPTDGLAASLEGYTLHLLTPTLEQGDQTLRLRVDAPDGKPLTDVLDDMTKPMHLVIVRSDLTGYQHVHPTLQPDGTWSAGARFTAGGTYRAYVSFLPRALATDTVMPEVVVSQPFTVAGSGADTPLPATTTTTTVDGYTVTFRGQLLGYTETTLIADIRRGGKPVTTLQPYLGAYGHLVAVRAGTLEYTHVHPIGRVTPGAHGPALSFRVLLPTPGEYRFFLQFVDGGKLHTAEITLSAL